MAKSKLTPEFAAQLVASCAELRSPSRAAKAVGLNPATLRGWRRRGREWKEGGDEKDRPYAELELALLDALEIKLTAARPRKGGRPGLFTEAIGCHLVEAAKLPAKLADIAGSVGISAETLRIWRRAGEMGDPLYAEFAAQFNESLAEGTLQDLSDIARIGGEAGDWTALAWRLERSRGYVKNPKDDDLALENRKPEVRLARLKARLLASVSTGEQAVPGAPIEG